MPTFNPTQYNEQISAESTGRAVDYQPYPFQQLISAAKPNRKPDVQVRRPVYPSYMTSNRGNVDIPFTLFYYVNDVCVRFVVLIVLFRIG